MASEVFRFATIRQLSAAPSRTVSGVIAFAVPNESRFIDRVRKNRDPAARDKLLKIVEAHIASSDFATRAELDPRLLAFDAEVADLETDDFAQASHEALKNAFGAEGERLGEDQAFQKVRKMLGDSIVAACIDYALPAEQRARLTRLAAACAIADALSRKLKPARADYEKPAIVLPEGLFPLPRPNLSTGDPERGPDREAARTEREKIGRSIGAS
jgi:hypothetical protein